METEEQYCWQPITPDVLEDLEMNVDFRMFTMTADEYAAALFQDSLN